MKVLIVDTCMQGHHITYFYAIKNICDEYKLISNEKTIDEDNHIAINCGRDFKGYKKWIKSIKKVADEYKPDIIHFLYGDNFFRYFGICLNKLKKYKTIVTFHHMGKGLLKNISIKRIFSKIDVGVVHTSSIKSQLNEIGIKNVVHVEYPKFNVMPQYDKEEAKKYFGIETKNKILLSLGGTRHDKGLDILLEALNCVKEPFHLLIAGKESYFKKEYIEEKTQEYKDKVTICLKLLSDEEFAMALSCADYVVLPYRKSFNGASGPLGEGVAMKKPIIGPNHGSLKNIIETNNLGITFESENIISLAEAIDKIIKEDFSWNDKAEEYKNSLSVEFFTEKYKEIYNI